MVILDYPSDPSTITRKLFKIMNAKHDADNGEKYASDVVRKFIQPRDVLKK